MEQNVISRRSAQASHRERDGEPQSRFLVCYHELLLVSFRGGQEDSISVGIEARKERHHGAGADIREV